VKPSISFPIFHPFYQLTVSETKSNWKIEMTVAHTCLNTKTLPNTFHILEKHLPSIFHCDCFNKTNAPFREELKHTELGHLFEHMLLEYLCLAKLEAGSNTAEFIGKTSWNWRTETRGKFHIKIDKVDKNAPYFIEAVKKSIGLLNLILFNLASCTNKISIN
jgi:hypothetical protein